MINIRKWSNIPKAPADPIMGLTEEFKKDTFQNKINLSVGAYRNENGDPYILDTVKEAKKRILNNNHEYAGIAGFDNFTKNSLNFAFGKNKVDFDRIASIQTISGTGACRIAGEFINRFSDNKTIYLPNPTWGNHIPIMKDSGLNIEKYKYYSNGCMELDFDNMILDIKNAPKKSVFLFHVCAHNPTGIDPSKEQWNEILDTIKLKNHTVLFDCAYQGFASGNIEEDAFPIKLFIENNQNIMLAQSYSKNFGLYGERVGALSIFTNNSEEKECVLSQLKLLARPMYSNPPINGAYIVNTILEDNELYEQWKLECKGMADRIIDMRKKLRSSLEEKSPHLPWCHITNQIGMFCYSGFEPYIIENLKNNYHIYMTSDGRISMSGINNYNIEYLSDSVSESINDYNLIYSSANG